MFIFLKSLYAECPSSKCMHHFHLESLIYITVYRDSGSDRSLHLTAILTNIMVGFKNYFFEFHWW